MFNSELSGPDSEFCDRCRERTINACPGPHCVHEIFLTRINKPVTGTPKIRNDIYKEEDFICISYMVEVGYEECQTHL